MIRVLHIIKSLGRGGAEMLLPECLKFHDKEQFEFHYIYFLPWKDQMVNELNDAGGIVSCLNAQNNIRILFRSTSLLKYIQENKIDLIHAHLPVTGLLSRYIHVKTNIPVIYTEHNKQERYHWVTRTFNRYSFNNQSVVIAVSDDVKLSIQKNINPSVPVRTVENGINTGSFVRNELQGKDIRKQYGIPQDAIVIGTVAVFRFQKRLKEWVEVFSEMAKQHKNVYGLMVGQGPCMEEVQEAISAFGMTHRIKLAGLQSQIKPYYSAIDIFLMSSIYEGMPVALLEAMSMECAVVSTDAGGIKTVIRNNTDGLTVPADRWKDLAICLQQLVNAPEQITELGSNARIRVKESFSINRMVHALETVYHSVFQPN